MKKSIALVAAGLLALVVVAKTTHVSGYLSTLCSQAATAAKDQVPVTFDIERIRHEIASLDQDLDRMYNPVGQLAVGVKRLEEEVTAKEKTLAEQKKTLLEATNAVESGKKTLFYGNPPKAYSVALVKLKVAEDFKAYRQLEKYVDARKKELTAKEGALAGAQQQLQSFRSKKEEFKVLLAQLEAEHAANQVAAVGTDIKLDTTRAAQIAHDLDELKDKIAAQSLALQMKQGSDAVVGIRLDQPQQGPDVDLGAIKAHLEGNAKVTSTASSK